MKSFRALTASEVDVRIGTVSQNGKGVSLLLYKDARCDMNVLDETVGPLNWQKHYSRDNANCTVSIWDEDKKQWISKEDTGTESNTEAEKGLASDSFKRACFNWGIGRELYTAPFIWIPGANKNDRFYVSEMEVQDGKITALTICDKDDIVAFRFPKTKTRTATKTDTTPKTNTTPKSTVPTAAQGPAPQPQPAPAKPVNGLADKLVMELEAKAMAKNVTVDQICQRFKVKELSELTNQQYALCLSLLEKSSGRAS